MLVYLIDDSCNVCYILQVDDKYQYSVENKDNNVHGWISTTENVGFWHITPSQEFRNGGPLKQCLTSHVAPIILSVSSLLNFASRSYLLLSLYNNNNVSWFSSKGDQVMYSFPSFCS